MGMIKGALFALASTIFFLAVLSSAIFLTIGSSLDYGIVQNQTVNIVQQLVEQMNITQAINSNLAQMKASCNIINSNYNFSFQGYDFSVSCEDLNKSVSAIIDNSIKRFVNSSYYKEYDCNYWDCFNKYPPTFLISEKSKNYWFKLFYLSMTALIVSSAALFLLIKKKRHLPFLIGGTILASSAIILAIGKVLGSISNDLVSQIIMIFFSKSNFVFIKMLIIGIIILFVGLVIELFRAEFKIYNLFSKGGDSKKAEDKNKEQKDSNPKKK